MTIPVQPFMAKDLPGIDPELLELISRLGCALGYRRVALVGGAVRDSLLLKQRGGLASDLKDFDFVVEGNALSLAKSLQNSCGDSRVSRLCCHEAFQTVAVEVDGLALDFASARRETYPAPGENPVVEMASLELDLMRRDFTINAMALVLEENSDSLSLLDPYSGIEHLDKGELVFLHTDSVRDDPTRVIRAARYAARLSFVLQSDSLEQVFTTVRDWPWGWRLGDDPGTAPPALGTRLRMELELLFEHEPWREALRNLHDWGAYPLIDSSLQNDPKQRLRLCWARRLGLPLLPALISWVDRPHVLAKRLQLPIHQQRWLGQFEELIAWLDNPSLEAPSSCWSPADWTIALEDKRWSVEAVGFAIAIGHRHWRPMLRWCGRWRHLRSAQTAQELIAQGWLPGPSLGAELKRRRIDRLSKTR